MGTESLLQLRVRRGEAVMERVLGVIRFRGYGLGSMQVNPAGDDAYDVTLVLSNDAGRAPVDRHLAKLQDVERVWCFDMEGGRRTPSSSPGISPGTEGPDAGQPTAPRRRITKGTSRT